MTRLEPTAVVEPPGDLLHGLFPFTAKGKLPVSVHPGFWLQSYLGLALWSTHGRWEHRHSTEKGVPIFRFSLAFNAWILGHASESALALPGIWTIDLT